MNKATTGLAMPLTGIGTYQLRGDRCVFAVTSALELGYRHIDTAQMYGNEREVGTAIRASAISREHLFVTTKIWPDNFRAADFIAAAEKSLRALDTDYVDLLLLHWPNEQVPLEETLGALEKVLARGWARTGGVSNFSVAQMASAQAITGGAIACNQVQCNVRNVPQAVIAAATSQCIAITAYSPLGMGESASNPQLRAIGRRYDMSPSQVALRWLTQQGIAVIPKASSRPHLEENLAAERHVLSEDDIAALGKF